MFLLATKEDGMNLGSWLSRQRYLVKFQPGKGHCSVPVSHKENGMNLGSWLSRQRKSEEEGEYDGCLEKRLEDIGIVWRWRFSPQK